LRLQNRIFNMEYSKIVSVAGLPGLFELINSRGDGAIVRSLDDKKTQFVSSRIHNFSQLESIEIFTVSSNVNLIEVFQAMEKAGGTLPDTKDNGALKKYFEKIYPDMDFERVYASDMKKMIKWYEILTKNKIEIKLSEQESEPEPAPEPIAEKPAEKATPPKAEAAEEKPAKKASAAKSVKKEKEEPEEKPAKKAARKK